MAGCSSSFPAIVWAILIKDIQSELRNRYAINALVMFSIITLTAVSFSVGQEVVGTGMEAPFLWIVIFFS
ncbi:MAG: hypothetical protein GF307_12820, partial [candidate division Zixibacteria bacterium]|nr:hypothetical protein [candidate division Zixibacteria bacterium]